eukprot:Blabericola_migrator_1__12924@NODE_84_length_14850_cov_98_458703_g75_i0_p3_GENE_NODE_84_length_14850_cov_98_458703_g75_i0NODE_84_length_14850_cov_98_458703_g75_i0_p3_ORF_typecomplete_len730_score148_42Suf/PF05843_14/0_0035Suf/PF05843_14/1_6e03_NODE_84_length_14850_cov_98_458703_g75_i061178306
MGDVLANEVEARVCNKDNKEDDYEILTKQYPCYPTVWVAYAKYCHSVQNDVAKARRILNSVCSNLRALEIWICLLELEVATTNDNFTKYALLKAAVDDVGWDPRSLTLWDSFFTLFVSLHNETVKSLATAAPGAAPTVLSVAPVSSMAPLASIEATNKSFHERQAATDDISRFFTTVDQMDGMTSKAQSVKGALLRHPLRHEQPVEDLGTLVNEEKLRELSAKGDLNLEVFHNYLRRFALTPFLNAPSNIWRLLSVILPETMKNQLETCASHIQRMSPILFQGMTPTMFCRPSSPLMPELDSSILGYWESLLTKEVQDCWGIRAVDEEMWKARMEFLYNVGCRNLRYLPTLWFERAQFKFKQGQVSEGLDILEAVTSEQAMLGDSLPIVLSDAWEYVANDLKRATQTLNTCIARAVTNMSSDKTVSAALIYTTLLKNARLKGLTCWTASVKALMNDTELKPCLTDDLYCALVSFALYHDERPAFISKLIQQGLQQHPPSVCLRLLMTMPLKDLPKPPNYEEALISICNLDAELTVTKEVTAIIKRACRHYHLFGIDTNEVKKWFKRLKDVQAIEVGGTYKVESDVVPSLTHLYTSDYFETYRHYDAFCTDLAGVGLAPYLSPPLSYHRVIMPSGSLPPEQVATLVRGSERIKQLLEIVQSVAPSAEREVLEDSGSASERTALLQQVLLRTVERARARKSVTQQQLDQLKGILEDATVTRALHRWFEATV